MITPVIITRDGAVHRTIDANDGHSYPANSLLLSGATLTHAQEMTVTRAFYLGHANGTPLVPDRTWISAYYFWFAPDGTLLRPQRCLSAHEAATLYARYPALRSRVSTPIEA